MGHLKTKHGSLADRGAEFFNRKAEIVKRRLDSCGFYQQQNVLLPFIILT
jgi:hypothetical protein